MASGDPIGEALEVAGGDMLTIVHSVDEAIMVVRERHQNPDLAVLDLTRGGGLGDCHRLATKLREAPLLVIAPEAMMAAAYEEGADDCIATPVRRAELVARVRIALQLHAERTRRQRRERKLSEEIRSLQREKHDLERIVCVDSLTGLANRRHALTLLHAEWKRSVRDGTPLSIVMVDLDFFHAFNETYGHLGGDACLRSVTDAMVVCLRRPSDYLGRYGGEEFIAVLASTDALGARLVAERMRNNVEALRIPHASSSCARFVTISVGHASARPSAASGPDDLVAAADRALLAAKAGGRNRSCGEAPSPVHRERRPSERWRRFPIVVADPFLADRIPVFLAATRDSLATFRAAAEAGEYDRIRALARSLRTSANEHGFEPLSQLAHLLEQAARRFDRESSGRVVDEVADYLDHVQVTYRRQTKELDRIA
jgi:diguanylate cyclase (GGDEF)-like protein